MTHYVDHAISAGSALKSHDAQHSCSLHLFCGINGYLTVSGRKFDIAQTTLFFVPDRCAYSVYTEQSCEKCSRIDFMVNDLFAVLSAESITSLQMKFETPFAIMPSPDLLSLYQLAMRAQQADATESFPYLMIALLSELIRQKSVSTTKQQTITHQENLVDQAKTIIARDYAEKITLNSIARELFVNPSYLSVLFKRIVGTTFCQYVTAYRIERAKLLLCETNELVADIALVTGFGTTAYFVTTFGEHCGVTPTAYRKQNRHLYSALH